MPLESAGMRPEQERDFLTKGAAAHPSDLCAWLATALVAACGLAYFATLDPPPPVPETAPATFKAVFEAFWNPAIRDIAFYMFASAKQFCVETTNSRQVDC